MSGDPMRVEDVLRALEWALIYRLDGAFWAELQEWGRKSGIEMMGTEALEAHDLAEIVRSYLRNPKVVHDVTVGLAEIALQ